MRNEPWGEVRSRHCRRGAWWAALGASAPYSPFLLSLSSCPNTSRPSQSPGAASPRSITAFWVLVGAPNTSPKTGKPQLWYCTGTGNARRSHKQSFALPGPRLQNEKAVAIYTLNELMFMKCSCISAGGCQSQRNKMLIQLCNQWCLS